MDQHNNQPQQFSINKLIQVLLLRKWLFIFISITILFCGSLICLFLPTKYEASALIITIPQKVPTAYVQPTINEDIDEQIRSILQEITSRTSLEKLIKKYDLYQDLLKKYPLEVVVENMKKQDISIERASVLEKKSRRRKEKGLSFYLRYKGSDPETVAKVANALANMFVERNLKQRTSQAEATAQFLKNQLEKVYLQLKEREEALKNFKMTHMGELPEQTPTNLATLNALQQQLQSIDDNIRRAEERATLLRQQLNIGYPYYAEEKQKNKSLTEFSLGELKRRLELLQSRYTPDHPDVIALKRAISQKEKENQTTKTKGSPATYNPDSPMAALKFQLDSTELEIKQLKEEKKKLKAEIAKYQKRLENAPKREQELIELTRDYNNLKDAYDTLMKRKLEAEQAAALERKQQGAQFRIIDPAVTPEQPISPKKKKLLPILLLLSFGGPIGLAFVMAYIDQHFYDPDDLQKAFQIPVLVSIPFILSEEEKKQRKIKEYILYAASSVGYIVALLLFVLVAIKGPGAYSWLLKTYVSNIL